MIEQKIKDWLNESKVYLIANYDRLGLRASGRWAQELETIYKQTSKGYNLQILGEQYTGVLETGRKPNTDQDNIRAWVGWAGSTFLKKWVQNKGLLINPYAVAYKIAREGIEVPNQHNAGGLVSDVMTTERINKLLNDIGGVLANELKSDIIKQFK